MTARDPRVDTPTVDADTYETVSRLVGALADITGERLESHIVDEPDKVLAAAHDWLRRHPVPAERDYLATYREHWASIVETAGRLDFDKVARELHDYHGLLTEVPKVYDELAGLSKPNSAARWVIHFAQERQKRDEAYNLRDLLMLTEGMDVDEMRAEVQRQIDQMDPDGETAS